MARARRAKPRRPRALIGLVLVAVLAGAVVAALRFWPGALTASGPTSTPAASTPPSGAESGVRATPAPTPTDPPSPSTDTTATDASADQALRSCRARVRAADEVLEQARTGIAHWAAHVGAERDAATGEISVARRQQIFTRTRLQGPADQKRYADALRAYDRVRDASCDPVEGADAEATATLARCEERGEAQHSVLDAAAAAMGDWKDHLADMQRSRETHVENAQEIWLAAYRAAPVNLDAYDEARREFDPPPC